jgi:hypothetical protein
MRSDLPAAKQKCPGIVDGIGADKFGKRPFVSQHR